MITYNHARFIRQSVQSVLCQETNFPFELVIGEDCSTDNTREIIAEIAARDSRVRLLPSVRNLGIVPNFARSYAECRGRYISMIDGDDYWTSPHKLQRQFDLLESRPEVALCCHCAEVIRHDAADPEKFEFLRPMRPFPTDATLDLTKLLEENFIATSSVLFRTVVKRIPDWMLDANLGDWPLFSLISLHGKIAYLAEPMGVYRIHAGGSWSVKPPDWARRNLIRMLEKIELHMPSEYHAGIRRTLAEWQFDLARTLSAQGRLLGACPPLLKCLRLDPLGRKVSYRRIARMIAYATFPKLAGRFRETRTRLFAALDPRRSARLARSTPRR